MSTLYSPGARALALRLPPLCMAITGADGAEMAAKAESAFRDNSFLEFRLDSARQPAVAMQRVARFLSIHPGVTAIATCRRAANGGGFRGSAAAQLEILTKAAKAGYQLIDVELQTAEGVKQPVWNKLRSLAAIVVSYHDFRGTRKLDETYEAMRKIPADIYKLATTAASLADNVTMMRFLERAGADQNVVGVCMGEQGTISRVLGLRSGSLFTFAAYSEGEETAPGQLSARQMRDLYRLEYIDRATRVYGVGGNPVAQSLSPAMMNAALRRETVNAVFLPLQAKSVADLVKTVREVPVHGVSITMPYKQEILEHLDNTDALTAKIGACNTVVRGQDGKLFGFNTDVTGVVRPLESRMHISGARVLVVGAGGAARAAVFGLKDREAEVFVTNRTAEHGQKLARQAKAHYIKRAELKKAQFDVIINATPVGMANSKESPLAADELNARIIFDMVYQRETRLLAMAREKSLQVITGEEMFVQQGARQFEIWTAKPAPVAEMYSVVHNALAIRATAEGADSSARNGKPARGPAAAPRRRATGRAAKAARR